MAEKSLSYFMRDKSKNQKIVEVQGVESIKDENGNVVNFQVKVLNKKEIEDIYEKYRTRTILYDKKGKPIVDRGQAIFDTKLDSSRALRRIIVESLVYPDLKDKKLMEYYECYDVTDMPIMVFPDPAEYDDVANKILAVLGIGVEADEESDDVVEGKN